MAALVSTGCNDPIPVGDDCFSLDPWKDEREAAAEYAMSEDFRPDEYDRMLRAIGFCEYGPDEIGDVIPEYPRADIDIVGVCIRATTCEQCVGQDVDRLIRDGYAEQQDAMGCPADGREILAYERGCVSAEENDAGESVCCYSAAIVSECPWGSQPAP